MVSVHWTESNVAVDGVRVGVLRSNTAGRPPLVAAHGFTDSGACWTPFLAPLVDEFDITAPDARHHGRSDAPGEVASDSCDDLIGVIDQLVGGPVTLIGHSMGARTAAQLAGRRPDLVERLVLEDPPWRADHETNVTDSGVQVDDVVAYLRQLDGMCADELVELGKEQHGTWPDAELEVWVAAKQQVRVSAAGLLAMTPWGDIVSAIQCPTLLVHGEPDLGGLVSPHVAARAADLNPVIRAVAIDGAGHNVRRERPAATLSAIRSFVSG